LGLLKVKGKRGKGIEKLLRSNHRGGRGEGTLGGKFVFLPQIGSGGEQKPDHIRRRGYSYHGASETWGIAGRKERVPTNCGASDY